MFGFLNVNKPAGVTSRFVTSQIQRMFRSVKVGHAGTLDPMATGVLVIAIGPATRLIPYVNRKPKSYIGEFEMGVTSDTQDTDGDVVPVLDASPVSRRQLESVIPQFVGDVTQVPPKYSAIKIDGKRAYTRARRGDEFIMPERTIEVMSLEICKFEFPSFTIDLKCSSGTYVRTLGRDIALACQSDAVMTALRRTKVGVFDIANSSELDLLVDKDVIVSRIETPSVLLRDMSKRNLADQQVLDLFHGKQIELDSKTAEIATQHEGKLIAIVKRMPNGKYQPQTNFIHYWIRQGQYDFGATKAKPRVDAPDGAERSRTQLPIAKSKSVEGEA